MTNVLGVRGTGGPQGPARGTGGEMSHKEKILQILLR